jgi:hypothetical protein
MSAVWHTDEPCPLCATGMVLLGHGEPVQLIECRACGYCECWDFTDNHTGGGAE